MTIQCFKPYVPEWLQSWDLSGSKVWTENIRHTHHLTFRVIGERQCATTKSELPDLERNAVLVIRSEHDRGTSECCSCKLIGTDPSYESDSITPRNVSLPEKRLRSLQHVLYQKLTRHTDNICKPKIVIYQTCPWSLWIQKESLGQQVCQQIVRG